MRPCEALLRVRPESLDLAAVTALVGERSVRSHTEVAREFGVSVNTIRQSWRPAGMPGHSKSYPLAEIALWRVEYERELNPRREDDAETRRRRVQGEADKVERQAALLEMQIERERLEWIRVEDVQAAISAILRTASERLMQMPHGLAPSLPAPVVGTVIPYLERKIGDTLKWIAEELTRKVAAPAEHSDIGGSQ